MSDVRINGPLLRALRDAKKLEQKQVAELAGIHPSVVSRMEQGLQSNFKLSVIAAVAQVLDTGIDALLIPVQTSASDPLDDELAAVVPLLARLPVDHQRRIAALLRTYITTVAE